MPSVSKSQQRLFGMARGCQKGNARACVGPAKKIAATVSPAKVREFASKVRGKKKK